MYISKMSMFARYHAELQNKQQHIFDLFPINNIFPIIPSPKVYRYRNKINVSIGYNENNELEVGPMIKNKTISNPKDNYQISGIALKIIIFFKNLIKNSELKPVSYPSLNYFWRHITIYDTKTKDIMIVFHVQNLNKYQDIWKQEYPIIINNINKFISDNKYNLKSIYYQNSNTLKETRNNDTYYHLYGDKNIIEKIDRLYFHISPGSFFQVNTYTAEIIYKMIRILIINKTSTILDICCGTGIISMFIHKFSNKIFAIDSNLSSIENAKVNLQYNNINNVTLIHDKAEKCLPNLIDEIYDDDIIAIINPPRRGIYPEVIESLKKIKLKQIIYISCNAESAKKDIQNLNINPNKIQNIIPIDQFPWCNHYETIFNIIF